MVALTSSNLFVLSDLSTFAFFAAFCSVVGALRFFEVVFLGISKDCGVSERLWVEDRDSTMSRFSRCGDFGAGARGGRSELDGTEVFKLDLSRLTAELCPLYVVWLFE